MKKTTFPQTSDVQIQMHLENVLTVAAVTSNWLEKTGPLHKSGIFLDFAKRSVFIRKAVDVDSLYAGILQIPFEYESSVDLAPYLLNVPYAKILKVLQWVSATKADLVFKIIGNQVYAHSNNNVIQLNAEWYEALGPTESPFSEYKTSPVGVIEHVYESIKSDTIGTLQHTSIDSVSGAAAPDLLEQAARVASIDGNLRTVTSHEMPKTMLVGVQQDEAVHLDTIDTQHNYNLSYARMSLVLQPVDEQTPLFELGLHAPDNSIPYAYIQDLQGLLKSLTAVVQRSSNEGSTDISLYKTELDVEGDRINVLSVLARRGSASSVVHLTIPSASVSGMAPPSSDDLNAILPSFEDEESTAVLSLEYSALRETLEFWDSLQRVDGKDVITPLKPITFELVGDSIVLSVNSADGSNHATYDVAASLNAHAFTNVRVPFDTLYNIIKSPLFEGDDPTLTLSRPNTEEPAVLLIYRNDCLAAIAEFV